MPPFMPVQSLYYLCVCRVTEILYHAALKSSKSVEKLRKLILSSLHAGIRQHLLQLATRIYKYNTFALFDLLQVLLDKSITHLNAVDEENNVYVQECVGLFTRLEYCNAVGLQELSIRVRVNPRNDLEYISSMNVTFHRTLRHMTNLRVLVLRSICDNEILRILGRHCHHLEQLDMTSSWLVDDNGIKQLCLQNPDDFLEDDLSLMDDRVVNECCKNLQIVRIQDTNTSELGVYLLLLFIPNLRSLGGFIYYRNVGDAIINLLHKKHDLVLKLTDLWDTCLPEEKTVQLQRVAPSLQSLYTRGNYLINIAAFDHLTSLTVDFDFIGFAHILEQYLIRNGAKLKKLVLVDQIHSIDLDMLAELCPSLGELSAKLQGMWDCQEPMLPCLKTCRVRVSCTETLRSLLVYAANLENLEVTLEEESYGECVEVFSDCVILDALAENSNLKLRSFYIKSQCAMGGSALKNLVYSCEHLKQLGDLHLWGQVMERDVMELSREIEENNWDLSLSFRGSFYPKRSTLCSPPLLV